LAFDLNSRLHLNWSDYNHLYFLVKTRFSKATDIPKNARLTRKKHKKIIEKIKIRFNASIFLFLRCLLLIIAYNSILLSLLVDKYKAAGNEKVIAQLQKIYPVAWQHIHFLGHYDFKNNHNPIDFEAMLADITFK